MTSKELARFRRHKRIRKKVVGTSERPRLCVYKGLRNIYAQIIDDIRGHTLVSASTLDKEFKDITTNKGGMKMAKAVGQLIAIRAINRGIKRIVFDRSGYKYHGSIKALADSARETGLEF